MKNRQSDNFQRVSFCLIIGGGGGGGRFKDRLIWLLKIAQIADFCDPEEGRPCLPKYWNLKI